MMKNIRISILAGLLGLVGASQVSAGDNSFFNQGYVGISYYQLEQDNRFFGDDERDKRFDTGDVFLRLVGNINEYFDSELRVGATADDNRDSLWFASDEDGEFRHDYMFSGFLRIGYPMGPVKPYVAGGYTWGRERFESDLTGTVRERFRDYSYGAGIDIDLGERLGINIEAVKYYKNIDNVTLRGPGAGFYWRF